MIVHETLLFIYPVMNAVCAKLVPDHGDHRERTASWESIERTELCILRYHLGVRHGEFDYESLGRENKIAPTGPLGSVVPYAVRDEAMCIQTCPATKRTLVEF